MTEKFIGYFRLIDACGERGCPLCRCLAAESRRYLEALLHEQVTDVDTRRRIRLSWGFCNWHTWMLVDIAGSTFGAAIVYEDLVGRLLRRTGELRQRSRPAGWLRGLRSARSLATLVDLWKRRAACPGCVDAAATEARYLDTLLAFVDDEALRAAYALSDGLCVPHLVQAVEREHANVDALVTRTRQAWARLGRDLAAFVGKHDHRNRQPFTAAEAAACTRALEMLAGARGVFGSVRGPAAPEAR
ncbi:MAG TPA: DUF6062 family protein [Candidatus Acidoferrum sp.]|nr:DUF6062 family protein [Candidatus Acidoferrum sp.]